MTWSENTAEARQIAAHFERVDLAPALRERLTEEYVGKVLANAQRFEQWDGDELVGFCAIYCNRPPTAFLTIITSERAGIGADLLERAIQYCRSVDFESLALEVEPANSRAIELYRRFGFEGPPSRMELSLF